VRELWYGRAVRHPGATPASWYETAAQARARAEIDPSTREAIAHAFEAVGVRHVRGTVATPSIVARARARGLTLGELEAAGFTVVRS
jgi:ribosomal protein L13E